MQVQIRASYARVIEEAAGFGAVPVDESRRRKRKSDTNLAMYYLWKAMQLNLPKRADWQQKNNRPIRCANDQSKSSHLQRHASKSRCLVQTSREICL